MTLQDRAAVVAEVDAHLAALTRSTVDAVRSAVPAYQHLQPEQLGDVHAIAAWTTTRVLQCWLHGTGFDEADHQRFRAIGAARAQDGRPVAAVLRAYRVAAVSAVAAVRDLGRDRLGVDDVADLTAVLLTALDELSEALLSGHAAGRDRLDADRDRALRALLEDLVQGRQSSPGALADRSRELGLTLPAHPLVLLAEPDPGALDGGSGARPDAVLDALREASADPARALATRDGHRVVLLADPPSLPAVTAVLVARGWRGCAVTTEPLAAVSAVHRSSVQALDSAPPHAFTGRTVLDEGDLAVLALLGAHPGAAPATVVRTVLGRLVDPAHAHVLDGVRAFLATGSASAAAAALHVHPQTLRYRLRRAREISGRDPAHPWHHLALDVALTLHRPPR